MNMYNYSPILLGTYLPSFQYDDQLMKFSINEILDS